MIIFIPLIYQAPDKKSPTPLFDSYGNLIPNNNPSRVQGGFQIKLLIPIGASGNLIGKGGNVVKQISESSNCKIQLGDEADPCNTKERILFVNSATVPSLVLVMSLLKIYNFVEINVLSLGLQGGYVTIVE